MRPIKKASTRTPTILLALVLVLGAGLAACGGRDAEQPDAAGQAQQGVEYVNAELGRAVGGDGTVSDPTDEFGPNDTIYVSVETRGSAPDARLAARWTFEDGQEVDRTETTIAPNGPEHTHFHVSSPSGWPAGEYHVEITLNGRSVETLDFEVEG